MTPDFMMNVMKKYKFCIPVTVYISNDQKHKERFAVRSKYMTIDTNYNKYIDNFTNIRDIQKFLLDKSKEYSIPELDNTNIDKSIGLVHKTVIRYLRKILFSKDLKVEDIGINN